MFGTSRNHAQRWIEVMEKSEHTVTLIDLCGHEKYLKTTLFGLTGLMPDYCLLVVGSNMGVQVMTREHIAIACALNIPMFVAVTKVCTIYQYLTVGIFGMLCLWNTTVFISPGAGGHLSGEHSEDHPHCAGQAAALPWQDALPCEGHGCGTGRCRHHLLWSHRPSIHSL